MKTITTEFARELIDFAPTEATKEMGFSERQLNGAVAAYNMVARNRVAYLADEVGMGKTYVALGVLGLLRHLDPAARVMIIAPRENIQRKWIKELTNFVRQNWRLEDNRVKNLEGKPVYEPIACASLDEMATISRINDNRDVFLRMTSFSASVKTREARERMRNRVLPKVPWMDKRVLGKGNPMEFRDAYGRVLNAIVPDIDLLIVDEAHNLKHGFGPTASNRNRVMGLMFGHPEGGSDEADWYSGRIKNALLLSATPFEYHYADLFRQLDVLGFGKTTLCDESGGDPVPLRALLDPDLSEERKMAIVSRLLLRRVAYLKIDDRDYSKNMYRREWRRGGMRQFDDPMELKDTKQRLVVGLVQKKVAEVLGDRRFNNSFQIGMLSSFESFLESIGRRAPKKPVVERGEEDGEDETIFDGHQTDDVVEGRGVDTFSLETVIRSYERRFGMKLPHPKLDATASTLSRAFETGEKALVFVRRVATVSELKAKLDAAFDDWIRSKMLTALPGLSNEIDEIFRRYRDERATGSQRRTTVDSSHDELNQVEEDLRQAVVDDEGGTDTFFAWFFRGAGPPGVLSGSAFQKNRLSSMASVYVTLFEEDYVSWLLGRPSDPLAALAENLGREQEELTPELRQDAYRYFRKRSKQKEGYPRFYVFESYQVAALRRLATVDGSLGRNAQIVLQERFDLYGEEDLRTPAGFPGLEESIGIDTFITELVKRPQLRSDIWPDISNDNFSERFKDRERRRELLSAMVRLGASYIDLYLLAIRQLDSFVVRTEAKVESPARALAIDFLDLLDQQRSQPGFHAFHELSSAAQTFETLLAVNFPEAHHAKLSELAELFGRALQHQVPVGGMAGGVNKRLVRQFRMPGFPLVLATTDVLQEGEDLHTFCRNVVHYGITWTPSAMEQRTGRIDRIGSLTQRQLDGRRAPPEDDELIQVYFPHLRDTVEVFQVRRVLERLNKFITMVHQDTKVPERDDSRINIAEEVLSRFEEVPRIQGLLKSAFHERPGWLEGEVGASAVKRPNVAALEVLLQEKWTWLVGKWEIEEMPTATLRQYAGICTLADGRCLERHDSPGANSIRRQPFKLQLRSQVAGEATLMQCVSPVGWVDLSDRVELDRLYHLQRSLGMVKVCAEHDARKRLYDVTVRGSRLFRLDTTQPEEVEELVLKTVEAADAIEAELLELDADPAQLTRVREARNE